MTAATQLGLFDVPAAPVPEPPPPANASPTSQAAAAKVAPAMRGRRAQVLEYVRRCGSLGATRHEIAEGCGLLLQSICSVVRQLLDAGLLCEGRETRATPTGHQAAVLTLPPGGEGGAA